ncbi:autotransporter domain-containing protein [Alcaligenaceae bacterium]|nr:autotransporter domain-containing protein [Alcaligenaceae bacterium]
MSPHPTKWNSQRDNPTSSTVGLRASRDIELGAAQGRLHASLAWRHVFGPLNSQRTMRLDAGQPFTVAGTPVARDAGLIELGTDLAMSNNMQLGISYGAQLARGNREHVGKLHAHWRF